jgi:hypothetical protein
MRSLNSFAPERSSHEHAARQHAAAERAEVLERAGLGRRGEVLAEVDADFRGRTLATVGDRVGFRIAAGILGRQSLRRLQS